MLTSKQRSYLKSISNSIDTIIMIGKLGINKEIIKQVDNALEARELIKGKVLDTSIQNSKEISAWLSDKLGAEVVQVIGSKFIIYRKNNKESKIILPKSN